MFAAFLRGIPTHETPGFADLQLIASKVPGSLAERMRRSEGTINEAIVQEYEKSRELSRLSDPLVVTT